MLGHGECLGGGPAAPIGLDNEVAFPPDTKLRQVPVSGGRHSVAVACLPGDIKFPVGLFADGVAVGADNAYIQNLIYKAKHD